PTPAFAQSSVHFDFASGAAQTITFNPPSSTQNGSTLALLATATSTLGVTFRSLTPSVCSVSGSQVTTLAAGICTIAADQLGDVGYWTAAPTETRSFTVTGSDSVDVPIPTWAIAVLSLSMLIAVRRSQRAS